MDNLFDRIDVATLFIKSKIGECHAKFGIVLGTGLGGFTDHLTDAIQINYSEIPYFVSSSVESHKGCLIYGKSNGQHVVVLSGRMHYYEGYTAKEITFPIRVLKALGIEQVIITNASGGVNPHFNEGEIVIITDHINFLPDHPLRGKNDDRLGLRFPDMMEAYCQKSIQRLVSIAVQKSITTKTGVYLALQGPSLETPAEYKMANIMGADLVGMSSVPEVIVARHCEMSVLAISIVSNLCYPKSAISKTTLEEVIQVVGKSSDNVNILIAEYIKND